jgi:hypothetical protein
LFRAAQLRTCWQLCIILLLIFKTNLLRNIDKELSVASIEFFLFAGQRYFFSLKKSNSIFRAQKNREDICSSCRTFFMAGKGLGRR